MTTSSPIVSAPLVWVELVSTDLRRSTTFYDAMLGWKPSIEAGTTDAVIYLDKARIAGPICGIRPRTPTDPPTPGAPGPPIDRWTVRLAPPRPPAAADPSGDQLLRPRFAGPRLGRWGAPNGLCFAELRTQDVQGAANWLERRLDAVLDPVDDLPTPGVTTLLLESSVNPSQSVASIVDESDELAVGWYPCVQVASLELATAAALTAGALEARPRDVPTGCPGTAAAVVVDPGGASIVLVQHGPMHGRR